MNRLFSSQFIRFGCVGALNTLIGTGVMFFAYNVLHCGYWLSSALNYIIGSIFSYFANKYFTFRQKEKSKGEIVRFILNIAICYLVAYGLAEPLVTCGIRFWGLQLPVTISEQISMLAGMILFVIINFIGQKMIVFKGRNKN